MESFTLEVNERTQAAAQVGKAGSKICRREGFIPAVAYHKGETPIAVRVPYKEFTLMAQKARKSQVFTFKSSTPSLDGKLAIVKEIQQDYLKGRVLHVDFQTLKETEEIRVDIPVKVVGESPGVKNQNGILAVVTHEVAVKCLPKNIPSALEVDISSLNLGQSIHCSDLKLPAGVVFDGDPEETIVSVVASRAGEEAKAEAGTDAAATPAAAAAAGANKAAPGAKAAPAAAAKAPAGKK